MKRTKYSLKALAAFLAMIFCLSCFSVFASAAVSPAILVDNTSGAPGELIEVAVNIQNNPGIAKMKVELSFDKNVLTPVSVKAGSAISYKNIDSNIDVASVNLATLSSVTASYDGLTNITRNGEFFVFTFKVKENAKVGQTTFITAKCSEASNIKLEDIAVLTELSKVDIVLPESNKSDDDKEDTTPVKDVGIYLKRGYSRIKYMPGYPDGTFRPEQNATRYEVVEALYNLFDIDIKVDPSVAFKDVNTKYVAMVRLFASAGIVNGYSSDNTFRGEKPITRAEFCKIICIMLDLEVSRARDQGFDDISKHWAKDFINACAKEGLVQGKSEGRFDPESEIKRCEVVTILNRITRAKAGETCAYSDVDPNAWYFGAVAAAAK